MAQCGAGWWYTVVVPGGVVVGCTRWYGVRGTVRTWWCTRGMGPGGVLAGISTVWLYFHCLAGISPVWLYFHCLAWFCRFSPLFGLVLPVFPLLGPVMPLLGPVMPLLGPVMPLLVPERSLVAREVPGGVREVPGGPGQGLVTGGSRGLWICVHCVPLFVNQ